MSRPADPAHSQPSRAIVDIVADIVHFPLGKSPEEPYDRTRTYPNSFQNISFGQLLEVNVILDEDWQKLHVLRDALTAIKEKTALPAGREGIRMKRAILDAVEVVETLAEESDTAHDPIGAANLRQGVMPLFAELVQALDAQRSAGAAPGSPG